MLDELDEPDELDEQKRDHWRSSVFKTLRSGQWGRSSSSSSSLLFMLKSLMHPDLELFGTARPYGKSGGAVRFFVACSNAYASAINLGSLHAVPVKLTLNGADLGSKPAGKGG